MASVSQQVAVRPVPGIVGRNGLVDRYFYFLISLIVAVVVVAGFSKTVDAGLIHAAPRRPVLLWLHGAAFSAWVIFFILQSGLVRIRKVSWHRTLGWFGAALAALMVVLGTVVSVVMFRFDALVLKQPDLGTALIPVASTAAAMSFARARPAHQRRSMSPAGLPSARKIRGRP